MSKILKSKKYFEKFWKLKKMVKVLEKSINLKKKILKANNSGKSQKCCWKISAAFIGEVSFWRAALQVLPL